MKFLVLLLTCAFALLASSLVWAAVVEHTFKVQNKTIKRLCKKQVIVTVNGRYPGPTINVREGDTTIVHLLNQGSYNITIHWITEQVPIFLPNCALEFIALEPAAAGPFMDNYGWRYPVNDQISIYPTPDYSPRIRTPNLIPALDHGDPVLSANSSVHLLADIGTSTDNLDFGFFLILCYQHKYVTRLDIEADSAMTKFLGPHQGRYLYQGWTKSLICLNWTMVPINERLSRSQSKVGLLFSNPQPLPVFFVFTPLFTNLQVLVLGRGLKFTHQANSAKFWLGVLLAA
ncbi:hypothetical protein VNO77_20472 [Canavalia gladiata]|uniref:Plastocyanin-like domain-containing protein n=1 Tax=Canavalia gladiata TaxID=3824 RepID=A0AAN9LUF8_CANGL